MGVKGYFFYFRDALNELVTSQLIQNFGRAPERELEVTAFTDLQFFSYLSAAMVLSHVMLTLRLIVRHR